MSQRSSRLPFVLAGCGGTSAPSGDGSKLTLVAYSTPREVYAQLTKDFGALDARVPKELRAWLRRLHDEVHVTTIFVTHDQEEAMEIADQIVLMNEGRVEQIGGARDLYERPANKFVMTFIGPVSSFGDELVRPHDIEVRREPNGSAERATVERVIHLGFEVRADLQLEDGREVWVQMTRDEAEALELVEGVDVFVAHR